MMRFHLIGAGAFYFIGLFYETLLRRQGLGDGDAAILGCIGLWLSWERLLGVILIASLTGLILGGGQLLLKRQSLQTTPIPFGPFLCIGGLVMYFLQEWAVIL